ncbi:hypothetical protein N9573_01060 [Octadecabacter sp.]|nr:hypothetical protein [Octadecabacter sp.]
MTRSDRCLRLAGRLEQALEDNDHSAALDEDENDVAVDTSEKSEEYKTGDD